MKTAIGLCLLGVLFGAQTNAQQEFRSCQTLLRKGAETHCSYGGERMTINFQGASLNAVLVPVAKVAGKKLVISKMQVYGYQNYAFVNKPWDEILDVVTSDLRLKVRVTADTIYVSQ